MALPKRSGESLLGKSTKETQEHFLNARDARQAKKQLDLDLSYRKLITVMDREINHLMDLSYMDKLGRDASVALIAYVKLIHELQEKVTEAENDVSDRELEKLANEADTDSSEEDSSEETS